MLRFVYGTSRGTSRRSATGSVAHPMHVLLREPATPMGDARVREVLHRVASPIAGGPTSGA
jgi:hypothetical protein